MKKRKQVTSIILSLIVAMTTLFSTQVFAAGKGVPSKVTLTKISTKAYNQVTVNWKKESKSTKYAVYYKESGKKKWKRIATVGKTAYTHKSSKKYPISVGKKYDYTVRGYNTKTKKYGSYDKKGLRVQTRPNTTKLKNVKVNKNGSVTISWNGAGGADKYMIYRKTADNKWKKIGTVSSKNRSFTDKHPIEGRKNTYTVRSYNSRAKISGKYNTKGLTTSKKIPVKPEEKPESTPEVKPEEKPEPTPEAKPEEKPEPTPEVKPEEKPETPYVPVEFVILSFDGRYQNMVVGDTLQVDYYVIPENATRQEVRWESLTPDILSIDPNGKITALKKGTGKILAKTWDGKDGMAEFTVRNPGEPLPTKPEDQPGYIKATKLEIKAERTEFDSFKQTAKVTAKVYPENATNKKVNWYTTDGSVVVIDSNGQLVINGEGTAYICASTYDGLNEKIKITVKLPVSTEPYVEAIGVKVRWNKSRFIRVGEKNQYKAEVVPSNATNQTIRWTSSNEDVIKIDQNGVATAVGHGKSTIIAYAESGPGQGMEIEVDLNYWPEEKPEEKPEPTPEVKPEEKPEPTPEPTPEVKPEEKPEPTPEPTPEQENVQAYLDKVLELTNEIRGEFPTLRPYATTPEMQRAAAIRAKELAQKFSHTRPDGRGCGTALTECNVSFMWWGENIAAGYRTPEEVVTGWRNSGGHYGNMIDSHFQKMGVGYYRAPDGMQYWVQMFTKSSEG